MRRRARAARQNAGGNFFHHGGGWSGSAAARLLAANFDVEVAFRTNDLLRKEEWERLDEALVRVGRTLLNGIADLRTAGLTRGPLGLGVLIDQFEQVNEFTAAQQDMDAGTAGQEDTAEFTLQSVPIPITHKDFRVNIRHLQASRTIGAPVDTTNVELATRQVVEKLEDTLFNGGDVVVGGSSIFGYRTQPNRVTGTLVATWTNPATRDIIRDVIKMIAAAEAGNYFGPFMLYVPIDYWSELRDDYKADSERTFLERIRAIDSIIDVKPTGALATDNVILVQLTSDVVDLSIGQDITTVQWENMGGLIERFKVMAAMAPRVKSDAQNQSGVVHFTV